MQDAVFLEAAGGNTGLQEPITKGKSNMKTTIYLPMAAMLLAAALAVPAAAQNRVPSRVPYKDTRSEHPRAALPPPH